MIITMKKLLLTLACAMALFSLNSVDTFASDQKKFNEIQLHSLDDLMAPLVLMSNENILIEREVIKSALLNDAKLLAIAMKYSLIKKDTKTITKVQRQQLLAQVDIMPPSLALAQAAEESGWATSRFTEEGTHFLVNGTFRVRAWHQSSNVNLLEIMDSLGLYS